jgi:hypothetical protein
MSFDFSVGLDPIYSILSDECTLTPNIGEPITVNVIDKTAGQTLLDLKTHIQTIVPAAIIRVQDLLNVGVSRSELRGGHVELGGKCWKISSTQPKPGPAGEDSGEILLILTEMP